jgi:exodeoxyribonuclease VII large subunit
MARPTAKGVDLPLFASESRKFLTVSELNERIKGTLESRLDALWVQGEISNFRMPPSGHFYFTLKTTKANFGGDVSPPGRCCDSPENGMAVLCFGRVSVYTVRGDLQLYVDDMEPQGQGALALAFEQLKRSLPPKVCSPPSASESCRSCPIRSALSPPARAPRCMTCCELSVIAFRIGASSSVR